MTAIAHPQSSAGSRRLPFLYWLVLWLSVPLAALSVALVLWLTYTDGRLYPGVVVGDVSVGGMTLDQARTRLTQAYAVPDALPIRIRYGNRVWLLDARHLNQKYLVDDALYQAYRLGREGPLWQRLRTQLAIAQEGVHVPIYSTYDPASVRLWLNRLATELYRPLREPSVRLEGQRVVYVPGSPGREVDVSATWDRLMTVLQATAARGGAIPAEPVPLVVRESGPQNLDVQALEETVARVSTRPLRLNAGGVFALDPATLSALVTLTPVREGAERVRVEVEVNRERLRSVLKDLAAEVNVKPIDARLDYDPEADRFTVLSPGQDGWAVDVDAAVDVVAGALVEGVEEVNLPVQTLRAAVPMDATPAELGIRELVGEGTTRFRGSSAARVQNIVRAAEAVRGVVIPPGAVFSFNDAAGAITAANGYEDSLIIWGDRTAVGIGGGVCQVSTTLYRAAFFAGLPIEERYAHGYIVSWYGEPGFDATVYSPYVDFKFRNTTKHHLLVQPVVDTRNGVLTFRLWGTKPDWTVEVSKPEYEDVKPPPPPVYQEDPSLPKGTIKQVDWAKEGMTVHVWRTVTRGDQVLEKREFVSVYQPWRAVYLYGPGTKVPRPKVTPTPSP